MKVRCKKSLAKLNSLGLDQSTLQLARNLSAWPRSSLFSYKTSLSSDVVSVMGLSQTLSTTQSTFRIHLETLRNFRVICRTPNVKCSLTQSGMVSATCMLRRWRSQKLKLYFQLVSAPRFNQSLFGQGRIPNWTKTNSRSKFDRLAMVERQRHQQPCGSRPDTLRTAQPSGELVSVLDNIEVSPTTIEILAKGPKYVVTPSWSREKLQHTVQVEIAALAYTLRWQAAMEPQGGSKQASGTTSDNTETLAKTCPFTAGRKEPPRGNLATEKAIQGLQMDMQHLLEKCKLSMKPNITCRERTALTELQSKEDTIITKSDKGGELVVMKESHMRKLCMEHLSYSTTYKRL